jgi:hypothetical protein
MRSEVILVTFLITCSACSPQRDHYVRLGDATPSQLSGSWVRFGGLSVIPAVRAGLAESPPPGPWALELRGDGTCVAGEEVSAFVGQCYVVDATAALRPPICGWGLEPGPEGQELTVVIPRANDRWLAMRMGISRDTSDGEVVLRGACRSGGEYVFVRPHH